VAVVRTDVSEERIASVIRMKKISELEMLAVLVTANVAPSSLIFFAMMMETIRSSKTWVITKATRRHIQEDGFFIVTAVQTSNLTEH
jgi:hypothetical protein